jgi:hypothetical protein
MHAKKVRWDEAGGGNEARLVAEGKEEAAEGEEYGGD